ncbi:MAG: heme-binding protein [Kofleriaceae bacterium]
MDTAVDPTTPPLPSFLEHFPKPATQPNHVTKRRNLGFAAGLGAVAVGAGVAAALGGGKRSVLLGGAAALALGALRWQLARWFTESPAFEVLDRKSGLEMRRYPYRLEAHATVEAEDIEGALDRGFGRLACYIFGSNSNGEELEMTTPVVAAMRDGAFTVAFVMPPGRGFESLPAPEDGRVLLREIPERKIAALKFRGPLTTKNIEKHERLLLRALVDAGVSAKGSISFAGYDAPWTLPMLRRNEIWIEIV